jgi:hypothetical protein
VMALPTGYMDDPVEVAEPISEGDLARLIASQLEPAEEEEDVVEVIEDEVESSVPGAPGGTGGVVEETVEGGAPPPPPPPPQDPLVTICHHEKTKTVNRSALQAFLDQGATEGPCTEE